MPADKLNVVEFAPAGQQRHGDAVFPWCLQCDEPAPALEDTTRWLAAQADLLRSRLQTHGAILFRGFPLHTAEDFDAFVAALNLPNFRYDESLSNAVRVNYTDRVFSANEAPADVTIHLHHEMAQTPIYPGQLFFYCQTAAESGGATPLCRSDALFSAIQDRCPRFASACETHGLRYTHVMPSEDDASSGQGRSWQSTFRATNRAAAESRLRDLGYKWEWLADGCLRATTPRLSAVREIQPGRKVFFNQLIAAFRGWKDSRNDPAAAISFGNGTPLDPDEVLAVAELAEELTFDVKWQASDVAWVDNFLVMHGRRAFRGTRKVLASLVADA